MSKVVTLHTPHNDRHYGTVHIVPDHEDGGYGIIHESESGNSYGPLEGPFATIEEAVIAAQALNKRQYYGWSRIEISTDCDEPKGAA